MSELEPAPHVATQMPTIAAGWYLDPGNTALQRYWDGAAWTEHVAPVAAPPATPVPVVPTVQPVVMLNQPTQSVTLERRGTNHLFHLVMSILTVGVWAIFVWLPVVIVRNLMPKRRVVTYNR